MRAQGIDFKWARMHIDSLLISDVAKIGTKEECWDYVFIHFKYLKEGCELSYDRASNLIPKDTLDNSINKSDIEGDMNFLDASGNINSKLVINIKELTIGSVVIKNVKASICEECVLKGINLLGLNAIKGLGNIYIDFEKDRIILNRFIN